MMNPCKDPKGLLGVRVSCQAEKPGEMLRESGGETFRVWLGQVGISPGCKDSTLKFLNGVTLNLQSGISLGLMK